MSLTIPEAEKLRRTAVRAARERFPGATWTGSEPIRDPGCAGAYWLALRDMHRREPDPIRVLVLTAPGSYRVRRVERGPIPVT